MARSLGESQVAPWEGVADEEAEQKWASMTPSEKATIWRASARGRRFPRTAVSNQFQYVREALKKIVWEERQNRQENDEGARSGGDVPDTAPVTASVDGQRTPNAADVAGVTSNELIIGDREIQEFWESLTEQEKETRWNDSMWAAIYPDTPRGERLLRLRSDIRDYLTREKARHLVMVGRVPAQGSVPHRPDSPDGSVRSRREDASHSGHSDVEWGTASESIRQLYDELDDYTREHCFQVGLDARREEVGRWRASEYDETNARDQQKELAMYGMRLLREREMAFTVGRRDGTSARNPVQGEETRNRESQQPEPNTRGRAREKHTGPSQTITFSSHERQPAGRRERTPYGGRNQGRDHDVTTRRNYHHDGGPPRLSPMTRGPTPYAGRDQGAMMRGTHHADDGPPRLSPILREPRHGGGAPWPTLCESREAVGGNTRSILKPTRVEDKGKRRKSLNQLRRENGIRDEEASHSSDSDAGANQTRSSSRVWSGATGGIVMQMQQRPIRPFSGLVGADANQFLKNYEKMSQAWTPEMRLLSFGQYLEHAAADWLDTLEQRLKEEPYEDATGAMSNRWDTLSWSKMKRLFSQEYVKDRLAVFMGFHQRANESGTSYVYKGIKLHAESGIGFSPKKLIKELINRMSPRYKKEFKNQRFSDLEEFKEAVRDFDQERVAKLRRVRKVEKRGERGGSPSDTEPESTESSEEDTPRSGKLRPVKRTKKTVRCAPVTTTANDAINANPQLPVGRCWICGEAGHRQRECPRTSTQDRKQQCYRCHGYGHYQNRCPTQRDEYKPRGMDAGRRGGFRGRAWTGNPRRRGTWGGEPIRTGANAHAVGGNSQALVPATKEITSNHVAVLTLNCLNKGEGADKQMVISIKVQGSDTQAIWDSGSGVTGIGLDRVGNANIYPPPGNRLLVAANGEALHVIGVAVVVMEIGDANIRWEVTVVGNFPRGTIIIGNDFISRYMMCMDGVSRRIHMKDVGWIAYTYGGRDRVDGVGVEQDRIGQEVTDDRDLVRDVSDVGEREVVDLCDEERTESLDERQPVQGPSGLRSSPGQSATQLDALEVTGRTSVVGMERGRRVERTIPPLKEGMVRTMIEMNEMVVDDGMSVAECESNVNSTSVAGLGIREDESSTVVVHDGMSVAEGETNVDGTRGAALETSVGAGRTVRACASRRHSGMTGGPESRETSAPYSKIELWDELVGQDVIESLPEKWVVSVIKHRCIPPQSRREIPVHIEGYGDRYFMPSYKCMLVNGVVMDRGIVDESVSWVHVFNISDNTVHLYPNMRLGIVERAQEVHENEMESDGVGIHEVCVQDKPLFQLGLCNVYPQADKKDVEDLKAVLEEYWDVFAIDNRQLGCTDIVEHSIDTGDHPPIKQRMWGRFSEAEHEMIAEQLREMLECGVIVKANSPWCSNVVLVPKPDGKMRFCVDFRQLNKLTPARSHFLPRIQDLLDTLGGSSVFHTLDALSGYWQIKLCEKDGSDLKTAFVTREGVYMFKRLAFGLKNAPAEYVSLMEGQLGDLRRNVAIYVDDIAVHGKTGTEANHSLRVVLERLKRIKFRLKLGKCRFLYPRVKLLGFVVSSKGVEPDAEKVESIIQMPVPATVRKLRAFLGMVNYFRKFIPKLAFVAKPLYELLETGKASRIWQDEQMHAFTTLKQKLIEAPTLAHYDITLPIELHTDACDYAVAGVLMQIQETTTKSGKKRRQEMPLQFISRTLRKNERMWSIPEKEALALMFCLTVFRPYLALRHFTVRTDAISLTYLQNLKDPIKSRIGRWALKLNEFDCEIKHVPGHKNKIADCLSRNPFEKELDADEALYVPTFGIRGRKRAREEERVSQGHDDAASRGEGCQEWKEHEVVTLKRLQEDDEWCGRMKDAIGHTDSIILSNGLVCHRSTMKGIPRLRVLVPASIRAKLIEEFHDPKVVGHLGMDKTIQRIATRFVWPNMVEEIQKYIRRCLSCLRHKVVHKSSFGPLHPIFPLNELPELKVAEFWSSDILGPLPMTVRGNTVIIVATDLVTRYVVAEALPNSRAETVANFLVDKIICVHGAFRILLTDNGKCYQSKMIKEIVKAISGETRFTNPYTPSINGLTERANKTLCEMLRHYVLQGNYIEWDTDLPALVFAHNTSIQKSLQAVPFTLFHGREALLPMDVAWGLPTSSLTADAVLGRIPLALQTSQQFLQKAQDANKKRYDAALGDQIFIKGDMVMYYSPIRKKGIPEKLMPRARGPFRLVKMTGRTSAIICEIDDTAKSWKVDVRKLRPVLPRDPASVSEIKQAEEGLLPHPSNDPHSNEDTGGVQPDVSHVIPSIDKENPAEPVRRSKRLEEKRRNRAVMVGCIGASCGCPLCFHLL